MTAQGHPVIDHQNQAGLVVGEQKAAEEEPQGEWAVGKAAQVDAQGGLAEEGAQDLAVTAAQGRRGVHPREVDRPGVVDALV